MVARLDFTCNDRRWAHITRSTHATYICLCTHERIPLHILSTILFNCFELHPLKCRLIHIYARCSPITVRYAGLLEIAAGEVGIVTPARC